jgi:predicted ABC-type ATPase
VTRSSSRARKDEPQSRARQGLPFSWLDARPIVLAVAGPNGAGKTTFFHAHLATAGLRFVNADVIGRECGAGPYEAAQMATDIREAMLSAGESFVFETVFSDPVGDKLAFLRRAASIGYTVGLVFIGLSSVSVSDTRVAMRVSQGGHDVPPDKLTSRYPRTLANLALAIAGLPHVLVYDNDDLGHPYRHLAEFEGGRLVRRANRWPQWLAQAGLKAHPTTAR